MKNLVSNWNHFNKQQTQVFNGKDSNEFLSLLDSKTSSWDCEKYPQGEYWKYVSYNQLPTTALKMPEFNQQSKHLIDQDFIHFEINNFSSMENLQPQYLPEGLSIVCQAEALQQSLSDYTEFYKSVDMENPFNDCAGSFAGMGLVISVEESVDIDKPIKLTINLDSMDEKNLFCTYNVLVNLEKASRADVLVEIMGSTFDGLANIRVDAILNEQSTLNLYTKENGSPDSHIVYNMNSSVAKCATFSNFDLTLPSQWSRHNVKVDLNEEGAEAHLRGAYLNNKKFFTDHHTVINHNVGKTTSFEDYRGILGDSAKAVFNGRVFVEEKASQSNSEQINKNLMLSKKAEINTKPELQIYNDDVKAAHGATIGQIDEEQKFYLLSRGFTPEQCMHTLSKAFVYGLLDQESDVIKNFFETDIDKCLSQLGEV